MENFLKSLVLTSAVLGFANSYAQPVAADVPDEVTAPESVPDVIGPQSGADENKAACWHFDGYPNQCRNTIGCQYNYRTDRCVADGGGGNRRYWICEAADVGWEEHWGGHRASAWSYAQAYNQSLAECRQFHSRCVVRQCYQR